MVEYAFLSDFDLLRDSRQDVRLQPWATPAGRLAMDQHFKIFRACEEIQRLNVEVRRVATQLRDEARYLQHCEEEVRVTDPLLAHQIYIYRNTRGRFTAHHQRKLEAIAKLKGFSGSIEPGESLDTGRGGSASWTPPDSAIPRALSTAADEQTRSGEDVDMEGEEFELEEEEADDEAEMQDGEDIMDILAIAMDRAHVSAP